MPLRTARTSGLVRGRSRFGALDGAPYGAPVHAQIHSRGGTRPVTCGNRSGAEGTRTPDPLHAMQVRYQLRHSPGNADQSSGWRRPPDGERDLTGLDPREIAVILDDVRRPGLAQRASSPVSSSG